jgi:sugar phosphate isomerase/epimerase
MNSPILERVSYHAVYDASIIDALEYARDNGFAGIQVAVETPHLSFESLTDDKVVEIASFTAANNLYITLHAPDETASLFQPNRLLRAGILNYYRALFKFAAQIKARLVTIHIGQMTSFPTDTVREMTIPEEDRAIYREVVKQNLDQLLDFAAGRFTLCIENYALDQFSLLLLRSYLDDNKAALCWDIPKSWNNSIFERFFVSSIEHVKQVHLHDIRIDDNGRQRGHRVIGSGEIDFGYYLEKLAQADVLDYCIEVRPREKARESLQALKNILGVL